jgi:hypothetical protein
MPILLHIILRSVRIKTFSNYLKTLRLDPFNAFGYLPNRDLAVASTAVYGTLTLLLTILSIYYRTWYFLVMTISGTSEVVGYVYRCSLANNPDQKTPYVLILN